MFNQTAQLKTLSVILCLHVDMLLVFSHFYTIIRSKHCATRVLRHDSLWWTLVFLWGVVTEVGGLIFAAVARQLAFGFLI